LSDHHVKQAEVRVASWARKWRLDELLDVGGMAAVYAATHKNGNRVAIKVLHRQYAKMPEATERFLREGYVANKVGHPGAVSVLDDDVLEDGTPFLVMELLDGEDLEGRLTACGTLTLGETLSIADAVLDVLASAHDHGVIHRDIKPPNVFLTSAGQVKVLDFGLARVLDGAGSGFTRTRTGTVVGTASYMSPEQARGKRELIDHRTDIFAVGGVMFRALSGRNIHLAETPMDRLMAAMSHHAPLLETVARVPPEVAALVNRALAFQKADRWADAREMQRALRSIYAALAGNAPQPPPGRPAPRRRSSGVDDIHVSVVIDEPEGENSIFVELEDETGNNASYELRKAPGELQEGKLPSAPGSNEELPEVSVIEVLEED
jgi:serine/threonine-protein kinase